jgi:hypothetical protein
MKEVEQEVNAEGQGMLHSNEPISSPRAGSHSEDPNSSYGSFDLAWTTVKSVFCTLNKIYKMYIWMDGSYFYMIPALEHLQSRPPNARASPVASPKPRRIERLGDVFVRAAFWGHHFPAVSPKCRP